MKHPKVLNVKIGIVQVITPKAFELRPQHYKLIDFVEVDAEGNEIPEKPTTVTTSSTGSSVNNVTMNANKVPTTPENIGVVMNTLNDTTVASIDPNQQPQESPVEKAAAPVATKKGGRPRKQATQTTK